MTILGEIGILCFSWFCRAAREQGNQTMLGEIAVMLIFTFGLSRVLLYLIPKSVLGRRRIILANAASVLLIALLYVILVISEPDVKAILFIGIPFAAACQALWYWRDVSKLPTSLESEGYQSDMQHSFLSRLFSGTSLSVRGEEEQPLQNNERQEGNVTDRWNALLRFDDEIRTAAERLRPFGDTWVDKLGQAYFTLNEDRKYLPNIVRELIAEAEAEQDQEPRFDAFLFRRTADGKRCTDESLAILREAQARGYKLGVLGDKTFTVTKSGGGFTSYLRSNNDIQKFSVFAKLR
jgi:hypothetical protein